MKAPEGHIEHLTLVLIKNYLEDRLDNKTRHTVEQHLLDCDLCNDAFEGYQMMGTENADEDVSNLKARISVRTGGRRVMFRYRYYGIAAALAILLVSGYYFFEFGVGQVSTEIAQKEQAIEGPSTSESSLSSTVVTDSLTEEDSKDQFESVEIEEIQPAIAYNQQAAQETPSPIEQPQTAPAETHDDHDHDGDEVEVSRIRSALDQAQPLAQEPSPEDLTGQGQGGDAFEADQALALSEEEQLPLSEIEELTLSEEESQDSFFADEEAVEPRLEESTVIAEFKKSARTSLTASGAASRPDVLPDGDPRPQSGMENYLSSIQDRLQYPAEAQANNIEGDVILKFMVRADGTIDDLTVAQSLGYGCDQEAIRLVREGERWLPAVIEGERTEQEMTLTIPFKLN